MSSPNSEQPPTKKVKLDHFKCNLWLINNYEYSDGAFTIKKSILAHAQSEQLDPETVSLNSSLGKVINSVWKGKVISSKKRTSTGRHYVYNNLKRRMTTTHQEKHEISELQSLEKLYLRNRWSLVKDNEKRTSLVYITRFELDERRVVHEISFDAEEANNEIAIFIKSGVFKTRLDADFPLTLKGTLAEKAETLMRFVESSQCCIGIPLEFEQNDEITANLNIYKGFFKELVDNPSVNGVRVFSKSCHVFINSNAACEACRQKHRVLQQKRKRREMTEKYSNYCKMKEKDSLPCNTNHRYMTKEEIIALFREERKKRLKAEKSLCESQIDEGVSDEEKSVSDEEKNISDEEKSVSDEEKSVSDEEKNISDEDDSESDEEKPDETESETEENNQDEASEKDESEKEKTGLKWKIAGSNGLLKIVKL